MFRGFYTAASGMISQQRRQEMISNNIANVNTPGYKADRISLRSFPELLIHEMNSQRLPVQGNVSRRKQTPIGLLNTGVYTQELTPNFQQGMLRNTGLYTDVAIIDEAYPDEEGAVFFTVENEEGGLRYTRNGNFQVDGQGYLTTNDGLYVLDQAGNRIFTGDMEFVLHPDGTIEIAGMAIPLGLSYIANPKELTKEGHDLFNPEPGNVVGEDPAAAGALFSVKQGFLEGSNVDTAQAMVDMIQAYRNFEMNQRVLKEFDNTMNKTVNEVGRLR